VVRDPAVLERRALIRAVMCDIQVELNLKRFPPEWLALQELALDGLVELSEAPRSRRCSIRSRPAGPRGRGCCEGAELIELPRRRWALNKPWVGISNQPVA
jgi:hypothetical protein